LSAISGGHVERRVLVVSAMEEFDGGEFEAQEASLIVWGIPAVNEPGLPGCPHPGKEGHPYKETWDHGQRRN
jgi:hypothetical protein